MTRAISVPRLRPASAIGLLLVVTLFCVPLFMHLGALDMENDEAGYSYAVDRILETGNWLTPRTVPLDYDFVEKPPLMFWIVAGSVKIGLLAHNDFGMRFFAALFGCLSFVYVYLIGCRVHGPVAGVAACFMLFTYAPLLYEHGLRTNNMEAPLFLSYCAGVFHFIRWVDADSRAASRSHAASAAAAFVLGFMTKFVAAIFLPMVWVVAVLARPDRLMLIRTRWRQWLGPGAAVVALISPWFVIQTVRMGSAFWHIIVGQHVYERFTTGLNPGQLEPWWFYFTQIRHAFASAGSQWVVLIGLGFLVIRAFWAKDWLARLLLAWAVLPLALISIGTSKSLYYADPFIPPLALGAGWMIGAALTRLYAITVGAGGSRTQSALLFSVGALVPLWLLPLRGYAPMVEQTAVAPHPLRTIRDCVRAEIGSGPPPRIGTYVPSHPPTHAYFFYLRPLGPYLFRDDAMSPSVRRQLFVPDWQSLVIFDEKDYRAWEDRVRNGQEGAVVMPPAVRAQGNMLVVMPGRLQSCIAPAIAAGAGEVRPR